MATHQLLDHCAEHVLFAKLAALGPQPDLERRVEQHVAELLRYLGGVVFVYGVQQLVALLPDVVPHGCAGLLAVPGAAVRAAKMGDQRHQAFEAAGIGRVRHVCHLGAGRSVAAGL